MNASRASPAILIVEDDPLIRIDIALAFSDAGFAVIEAGSADDALEILNERECIALVFTDIEMPGRHDGLDLAEHVARTRPEIPVLVTSGGRGDVALDPDHFVPKPYDPQAIISRARALADASNPEPDLFTHH